MDNHRPADTPKDHLMIRSLGFLLCSLSALCGLKIDSKAASTAEEETTPPKKTPARCHSSLSFAVNTVCGYHSQCLNWCIFEMFFLLLCGLDSQCLNCGIFEFFYLLLCGLVCGFTTVLSTASHSECSNESLALC